MQIQVGPYLFRPALIPGIVVLCLLPVLISLGIWQLGRADEKRALLEQHSQRSHDKRLRLTADTRDDADLLRYREVAVTGRYDSSHQFLIDNQIVQGKVGYFVMTPLILQGSKKAVLVNRGWVALNKDRSRLPDIAFDDLGATVSGRVNYFPRVGYKLAGAEIPTPGWPAVVQVVDRAVLEERLGYPLFSFQIELDADQENGYLRDWRTIVPMPPEKHFAYAMQWFGLAFTLVILFIGFSCKKPTHE